MKSQKGSTTVIALIMLLFLVILCGGWIVMMTQEKTNALADARQQQAWYAAEAGYKRAAVLLGKKETTWDWTTNSTSDVTAFNKGTFNRKVDLQTLTVNGSDLKDTTNNPWYAVHVDQIASDTYSSYPTSSGASQNYAITSVGEYMGERKIIKRSITISASSTSKDTSTFGIGLFNAGGTVTVGSADAHGDLSGVDSYYKGDIIATNILTPNYLYLDGKKDVKASGYNSTLYTKVENSWFVSETDAMAKYTALKPDSYYKTIPAGQTNYLNITGQTGSITGGAGSVLYVYGDALNSLSQFVGPNVGDPTDTTVKPFVIVVNSFNKGGFGISGRVMIIDAGDFSITGWGVSNSLFMLFANGDVTLSGIDIYKGFISSNKNIVYNGGGFTGEMQAYGNININKSGGVSYSHDVVTAFGMPEGITTN